MLVFIRERRDRVLPEVGMRSIALLPRRGPALID